MTGPFMRVSLVTLLSLVECKWLCIGIHTQGTLGVPGERRQGLDNGKENHQANDRLLLLFATTMCNETPSTLLGRSLSYQRQR